MELFVRAENMSCGCVFIITWWEWRKLSLCGVLILGHDKNVIIFVTTIKRQQPTAFFCCYWSSKGKNTSLKIWRLLIVWFVYLFIQHTATFIVLTGPWNMDENSHDRYKRENGVLQFYCLRHWCDGKDISCEYGKLQWVEYLHQNLPQSQTQDSRDIQVTTMHPSMATPPIPTNQLTKQPTKPASKQAPPTTEDSMCLVNWGRNNLNLVQAAAVTINKQWMTVKPWL